MDDRPTYKKYLQLDKVLNSQELRSKVLDSPVHDEMLFIIIHQIYELWFKQIIFEIDSVVKYFDSDSINEISINTIVSRLERINDIQKITIKQINILESMTPMDFLEFRDLLNPASGFQSLQFRIIENLLGLPAKERIKFSSKEYDSFLSKEDKIMVIGSKDNLNIFKKNIIE